MAYPFEIIERLQQLKTSYQQLVEESVQETADQFNDLNKEQLYAGKNSNGKEIGQYASEPYAEMKNQMNPVPGFGVPDLKLTGALYAGMTAQVQNGEIVQDSAVEYLDSIEEKYGTEIWGLDEDKHDEYVQDIFRPVLQDKVSELTGLTAK